MKSGGGTCAYRQEEDLRRVWETSRDQHEADLEKKTNSAPTNTTWIVHYSLETAL